MTATPSPIRRRLGHLGGYVVVLGVLVTVVLTVPSRPARVVDAFGAGSAGGGIRANAAATSETDCGRRRILGPDSSCRAVFHGDNGGTTYRSVSADHLTVVDYSSPLPSAIASAAPAPPVDTPQQMEHLRSVYTEWFNRNYETYGRRVDVVNVAVASGTDPAAQRAAGVDIDQKTGAFLTFGSADTNMLDELARRGIVSISPAQLETRFMHDRAPYVYTVLPSIDTTNAHIAEFITKRLGRSSTAAHAGEGLQGRPRRYGILFPTSEGGVDHEADLVRRLQAGGIDVAASYGYASDVNSAASQTATAVAKMRDAEVTTLLCLCDPVAPYFIAAAATAQRWFPEWLQTGYGFQDADVAARFYDQAQWRHNFGISALPVPSDDDPHTRPNYRAYKEIDPDTEPPQAAGALFTELQIVFSGIENAGPHLDPGTFRDALFAIDLKSTVGSEVTYGYSPTDFGGIKDAQEVWWDPDAEGPDHLKGHYRSVAGGRRFLPGQWPSTPAHPFEPACLPVASCGNPPF